MNLREAQSIAETRIANYDSEIDLIKCVVIEELTITKPWGWVFFYQNQTYLDTGNTIDSLGGNSPIIVNRKNGSVSEPGTALPIEHYIEEYESSQKNI